MVKKELLLNFLDGHMEILKRNVNSLEKLVIWESKFSHLKNLYSLTNGHKMASLIHGGSCINQLPINYMEDMVLEMNSEK